MDEVTQDTPLKPTPIQRNVRLIAELERDALHTRSQFDRFIDTVTGLAGSPAFLVSHASWFAVWIVANTLREPPFDPYPFSLLTVLVSLEAIILTSFVLMSQNRMARQADKRAHLDLQINLLAEEELTAILQMLRQLCAASGITTEANERAIAPLLNEIDIHKISATLDRELPQTEPRASS